MSDQQQRPMYTSYFANWRNYPLDKFQPIAICRTIPKFFKYFKYQELAPSVKIANYPEETFRIIYREYLDNEMSAKAVCVQIHKMCGDLIPVLLCYEVPHQFCHRHVLREWLTDERGVDITELGGIPNTQLVMDL